MQKLSLTALSSGTDSDGLPKLWLWNLAKRQQARPTLFTCCMLYSSTQQSKWSEFHKLVWDFNDKTAVNYDILDGWTEDHAKNIQKHNPVVLDLGSTKFNEVLAVEKDIALQGNRENKGTNPVPWETRLGSDTTKLQNNPCLASRACFFLSDTYTAQYRVGQLTWGKLLITCTAVQAPNWCQCCGGTCVHSWNEPKIKPSRSAREALSPPRKNHVYQRLL